LNFKTSVHIDTRRFSEDHEQVPITDQRCPPTQQRSKGTALGSGEEVLTGGSSRSITPGLDDPILHGVQRQSFFLKKRLKKILKRVAGWKKLEKWVPPAH
jgi:hypothetical protein